jgi:HSP20 family protein
MFHAVGPMLEIARIQSEINRLFDNLLELGEGGAEGQRAWIPNADISEAADHFIVRVELPGVSHTDLSLAVDGGNIIIWGQKRPPEETGESRTSHLQERGFGGFERVISINAPMNTHKAEATFRDGLLKITFPKVDNRRGGEVGIPIIPA